MSRMLKELLTMWTSNGRSVMALVLLLLLAGVTVNPQNCGCASGLCCSKYGYCGTSAAFCGDGCKSGPCSNSGGGSPSGGGGSVGTIISQSFFDGLLGGTASSCEGKKFYTYNAFIGAANAYSGFGSTGSNDVKKRELAAFFANAMHESGGLCYINERNPPQKYCNPSYTAWPCNSGKDYHGRGPLQLSCNCHSAITSGQGFGGTIKAINSGECNGGNSGQVNSRVNYYRKFCSQLGVDPGTSLSC